MNTAIVKKATIGLFFFLGIVVIWEAFCRTLSVPVYLVPSPTAISAASVRVSETLPKDFFITGVQSILGFIVGALCGMLAGALFSISNSIEATMMPYVIFLKTIPVVAIAPLLVIWFGAGMLPKVFLAASVCFFPVLIGTLNGLKELDPSLHDVFRSMGATQWQIFWWLKAPNCLVFLFPTFKIAVVFAVIGSIVAEFASANAGLGFKILMASFHVDTPAMFAYIIACSLLSMSLYGTLALLEHLFIPWSFTLRKAIK